MASKSTSRSKNPHTISSLIGEKEKIQEIIGVTKIGKDKTKSKKYYVVITHLKGSHLNYSVFCITQNKDVLRLKHKFSLIELSNVDFMADNDARCDFLLHFNDEKVLHFIADAYEKKRKFLINLYKMCKSILPKEALPIFKNVNTQMLEETVFLSATLKDLESDQPSLTENVEHEYKLKYLTKEEEVDLEEVCMNCKWEIESAEEFIAKQTMELSGLDKANIHSIMNVEDEIMKLFETMDKAIEKLDLLDNSLQIYSEILTKEESRILDISDMSSHQSMRLTNNNKLLGKTHELVELLSLPFNTSDLDTLNDYNLESFSQAVEIVQRKVDILSTHELKDMQCAEEYHENCQNFLITVPDLLYSELSDKFKKDWQGKHRARHINVGRFTSLLNWCKEFSPSVFMSIFKSYEESIQKCYSKEISTYFKDKMGTIQKRSNLDKGFSFAGKPSTSSMLDVSLSQKNINRNQSSGSLTSIKESVGSMANIKGSLGSVDSVNVKGSEDSMVTYQNQKEQNSKFDSLFCKVYFFKFNYFIPIINCF